MRYISRRSFLASGLGAVAGMAMLAAYVATGSLGRTGDAGPALRNRLRLADVLEAERDARTRARDVIERMSA